MNESNIKPFTYNEVRQQLHDICSSINNGYPVSMAHIKDVCNRNGALGQEFEEWFNTARSVEAMYGESEDRVEFFDKPVILSQAEQWALDHPNRLKDGDMTERDYLNGPDCMMNSGFKEQDLRFNEKTGQFEPEINYEQLKDREQERVRLFLEKSELILKTGIRGNEKDIAKVGFEYWKWVRENSDGRDKRDPLLTGAQFGGIAYLLDIFYKPNKAHKTPWTEVMQGMIDRRAEKVAEENRVELCDWNEAETLGYAPSPEEILMARETFSMLEV